jgi:cytochrome b involved in lipid metabolism
MFTSRVVRRLSPSQSLRTLSKLCQKNVRVSSSKTNDFTHAATILLGLSFFAIHEFTNPQESSTRLDLNTDQKFDTLNQPPPRPDLPTIPLEEVAEHCDESSLWFTFRGAVYDMTFFLHGHPGGEPVSLNQKLNKINLI